MVVVTRAAAAVAADRQQGIVPPTHTTTTKKKSTKKKKIVHQAEVSSTLVSSLRSSPTNRIPPLLSTNLSPSSTVLSSSTTVASSLSTHIASSPMKSSLLPVSSSNESCSMGALKRPSSSSSSSSSSDHLDDGHEISDDAYSYAESWPMESDRTGGGPQEKLRCLDGGEASTSATTWPIDVDEIKWCKTNRGNERVCMAGHTYDLMSSSLKNNRQTFRCSKKDRGCRSVVYVCMNSRMYKDCNHVDHNHPSNHCNVKRLIVLHQVRQRVSTEPTSITRIIEDEYAKSHLNDDERRHFLLPNAQGKRSQDSAYDERISVVSFSLNSLPILQNTFDDGPAESQVSRFRSS